MSANLGPYGLKLGVVPNGGGWRFPLPEEHAQKLGDPFLRADGFWKLCSSLRLFRIQLGLPPGAVEWEVAEYIKRVSPENALHRGREYPRPPEGEESYRPPIVRVTEWLVIKGRQRVKRVIKPDADERADICAKCPQNIEWRTSCRPCVEDVEDRAKNLRALPGYEKDDQLGACRLHHVLLNAAIFLDQDDLPAKQPDAPADCWLPVKALT